LHGTEPYGWTRKQGTLEEYIADTSRRLGGSGIDRESLKSLAKFAKSLPSPPPSKVKSALADRGRELFMDRGCGSCHVGGVGTDAKSHNVLGTTTSSDEIDTPSLIRVRMSGPYFHDGRYLTLDDLLADKTSKMGETSGLGTDEQAAMRAYLESL
ncbi:MAG: c-type cytochrome, partial [Myxococcales bacterium]|nr:c-type cytochrome [Myxococcales bacterium]